MQKRIWILLVTFLSIYCSPVTAREGQPAVTLGQIDSIQSDKLEKTIPLSIHLPENYSKTTKSYPVLYMMGSDYRTRFALFASTLEYMGGAQIPEMILIGVDLPEGNRVLLPDRETGDTSSTDRYIDFLEHELIPHVEKRYRTAPYRILMGASNSGLFSTYVLLKSPLLFNHYFASSPSLNTGRDALLKQLAEGPIKTLKEHRGLHIIYSDDDYTSVTRFTPEFSARLNELTPQTLNVSVDVKSNQGHVPATDLTSFLLALYPDYNPPEALETLESIQGHFAVLSERYGYSMQPPFSLVYELGIDLALDKKLTRAETIFQYAMTRYPEEKKAYIGMGVVYREKGNKALARDMFNKALNIEPGYPLAIRLIQRLDK